MMNRKLLIVALTILAIISVNRERASAQSCQTSETYGVRSSLPVDRALQSRIEVTYFTTSDPNAFITEEASLKSSVSYLNLNTSLFVSRLVSLARNGLASIRKQQTANTYLGEVAALNLERNSTNTRARMVNVNSYNRNQNEAKGFNRQTEIAVYKGPAGADEYYRLSFLSWLVKSAPKVMQMPVDFDAIVLMMPGQTAIFKLMSDKELQRTGDGRSYVAVTLRSVDNTSVALLQRNR